MSLLRDTVPSVILQAFLILFGAITLDGGGLLRIFGIAAIGYWLAVAAISARSRQQTASGLDIALLRWGYLPAVGVAWVAAGLIWPR